MSYQSTDLLYDDEESRLLHARVEPETFQPFASSYLPAPLSSLSASQIRYGLIALLAFVAVVVLLSSSSPAASSASLSALSTPALPELGLEGEALAQHEHGHHAASHHSSHQSGHHSSADSDSDRRQRERR